MPNVRVEFFGIPQSRAGVASESLQAKDLADLLAQLGRLHPKFERECLEERGALRPEFLLNLNGRRFLRDREKVPLKDGDTVMILSADAGG